MPKRNTVLRLAIVESNVIRQAHSPSRFHQETYTLEYFIVVIVDHNIETYANNMLKHIIEINLIPT